MSNVDHIEAFMAQAKSYISVNTNAILSQAIVEARAPKSIPKSTTANNSATMRGKFPICPACKAT